MRESRKFCLRISFLIFLLVEEGTDYPNTTKKRGIIGGPAKRH